MTAERTDLHHAGLYHAGAPLKPAFFRRPVEAVARALIGCHLVYNGSGGIIVEVEAYDEEDPASHCYGGQTIRNASMFGPGGHAYVYRSYGIHWCLNFVCGEVGQGCGVLLRALQPTVGLEAMAARRGTDDIRQLCSGPGKLCAALGVTKADDGKPLMHAPFAVSGRAPGSHIDIAVGPRIGLTKGVETPWRFGLAGSRYVSRPFPTARSA
ncbi:MAG TPA: DNA-3-methyladenine glycosylase [Dongiaceae bacterium]|nr:DNA-3-methyladenine glycosylase [Dongiaceae bacterium]